jgi:hypothetical protein
MNKLRTNPTLRHYGVTALWHYGVTALRRYGVTALRHYGTRAPQIKENEEIKNKPGHMALRATVRRYGTIDSALRHYGVTALRRYGVTALRQHGITALWHWFEALGHPECRKMNK